MDAIQYFKDLKAEANIYHNKNVGRWLLLSEIGFSYEEIFKIYKHRRYSTERHEKIIKRIDSNDYWSRSRLCDHFKITTSRLSQVLNGDSTSVYILDEIETILNNYERNRIKRLHKRQRSNALLNV